MATQNSKDSNRRAAARRTASKSSSGSGSTSDASVTKSDSKVAARAQLDEGQSGNVAHENLEQRAKDQERQQAQELKDGVATGQEKKAAEQRAKTAETDRASVLAGGATETGRNPGLQGGQVDQLTRRHGDEALTGHFVKIDLNADGVPDRLKDSGRDFGVYLEAATTDPENGYPLTARVRLRDETHEVVIVPHDALRPTEQKGR